MTAYFQNNKFLSSRHKQFFGEGLPSNNAVYDTTNIRMWTKQLEEICSTLKTENMDDVGK